MPISLYMDDENENKNETNTTELISDTIYLTENVLSDNVKLSDGEKILAKVVLVITLALAVGLLIVVFTCAYTAIMLFSMNKRRFISGDFLSGRKINDSISLMKTVKEICGYTFTLCYCNFYFWNFTADKPLLFYENIYIPDLN